MYIRVGRCRNGEGERKSHVTEEQEMGKLKRDVERERGGTKKRNGG